MQVNEIGLPGTQLYAFKVDETFHAIGYTMNRLQTPILNQSSPFELVFGIKLDYQMLKTFGVKCFIFLRPYNINNFDFKTQPRTFISYIHVHKGYKCLTPSKKQLYLGMSFFMRVVFHMPNTTQIINICIYIIQNGNAYSCKRISSTITCVE